jgi:dynein heavy chain
MARLWVNES